MPRAPAVTTFCESEGRMRHITSNPAEVRAWATQRRATPGLTTFGQLALALPGEEYGLARLGWEEFAGHFTAERLIFVFDDEPGSDFFALGAPATVVRFGPGSSPRPPGHP